MRQIIILGLLNTTYLILKRHIDRYLKNGVLESIVNVIKHANFQLHRVHWYVITRLQNSCLITFFKKNTEAATGGKEAVTRGVL